MSKKESHIEAFSRVLKYIEENLFDDLSLERLAEVAYTSKYHFHRLFKETTGESLSDYIKKRKLCSAAFLLVDTDRRIEDIAFETSYNSIEAFTRAFKKQFQRTPAEYRKNRVLWPSQVTAPITLDRYLDRAPVFTERVFPKTILIGYRVSGWHTAKTGKHDPQWVDQYWDFFKTLYRYDYPVEAARIFTLDRTTLFREDPKESYYREYESFHGVLLTGDRELSGLEKCTIPECKSLYLAFQGTQSEYSRYVGWLHEKYIPTLPYDVNHEYAVSFETMGLKGEFLNSSGHLDYHSYFKFCNPYVHEKMYYNSPDHVVHLYLPLVD